MNREVYSYYYLTDRYNILAKNTDKCGVYNTAEA